MAKRFRDTAIWKKEWYCKLTPVEKCLWDYITDNCDNCGVWDINKTLAEFQIGSRIEWDTILKSFNGNLIQISESKIFVVDYISFQYGELKETCVPHRNVYNLLIKHGISYPIDTLSINNIKGINTLEYKEEDKDKDKDKEGGMGETPDKSHGKDGDKAVVTKHKHGVYKHVLLTDEELSRLNSDFGDQKVLEMIKNLDEYIQMKGAKYKDHNLTMRNWERKNGTVLKTNVAIAATTTPKKKPLPEMSVIQSTLVRKLGNDWEGYPDTVDYPGWIKLFEETFPNHEAE